MCVFYKFINKFSRFKCLGFGVVAFVLLFSAQSVGAAKVAPTGNWYSGLWVTGVDNSGNGLNFSESDPHWSLTKIYNTAELPICQTGDPNNKTYDMDISGKQATVVLEKGESSYWDNYIYNKASVFNIQNTTMKVGFGYTNLGDTKIETGWVWGYATPKPQKARWISQNKEGRHDWHPDCKDPAGGSDMENSSTFRFRLTRDFKINEKDGNGNKIDLDSIRIVFGVNADNLIRIIVNDNILPGPESGNYFNAGFSDTGTGNISSSKAGVFKVNENKLEVEIKSSYSNIGFIIDSIKLEGLVDVPDPVIPVSTKCRPQTVVVEPKSYPAVSPASYQTGSLTRYNGHIIPVDLYIRKNGGSETKIGEYSNINSMRTVDITKYVTTGDVYDVYVKETERHIIGYDDHQVPDHSRPIYGTKEVCTGEGEDKVCGWVTDKSNIIGYHTKYGYSTDRWSGQNQFSTNPSPVGPCYDYKIDFTQTRVNPNEALEAGTKVTYTSSVNNLSFTHGNNNAKLADGSVFYIKYPNLNTKIKNGSKLTIVRLKFAPGVSVNQIVSSEKEKQHNNNNPCSHFSFGGAECTPSDISLNLGPGASFTNNTDFVLPDDEVGTKYCFASSVIASNSEPNDTHSLSGQYHHSAFKYVNNCFIVAKKPKVQVRGGDLLVGRKLRVSDSVIGNVGTSTSVRDGSIFGSWVEYGIFARGSVVGPASGAAFTVGLSATSHKCDYNKLTFANSSSAAGGCVGSPLGSYNFTRTMPDVAASFQNSKPYVGISAATDSGIYKANTSIAIPAVTIPRGKWFVINAEGHDVTIAGDIKYSTDSISQLNDVPQLVIIANNITIEGTVGRVDSWLVASGNLDTCRHSGNLTSNKCNNLLQVNGPVIAGRLLLNRTAGSGTGPGIKDPAEIFKLTPDAYVWAFDRASSSSMIKTTYTVELPPRL